MPTHWPNKTSLKHSLTSNCWCYNMHRSCSKLDSHGMQTLLITCWVGYYHLIWIINRRINFFMILEATSGMIHIYISYTQTMWSEDVYLMKKSHIYCTHVMLHHMRDISEAIEQLSKFYNQVITGPLFLKILMSLLNVVTGAKKQETYLKDMKCN